MTYRPKWTSYRDANVGVAAAAFADASCIAAVIQADPDNTADVFIGDSAAQDIQLIPGASISLDLRNLNEFYRKSASGTQAVNILYGR